MKKFIGIITANYSTKHPSILTETRPVASMPFLGRYRILDFALSNMVNSGARTIGMIMPYNYRSIIDHIGSGRDWDLDRKKGGLFILPGSAFGTSRTGSRFLLRDIENNKEFLQRDAHEYVIVSSANFVMTIDYNGILNAHIKSGADITVAVKRASQNDSDIVGLSVEDGRVRGITHGIVFGDAAFLDCFVIKRTLLLELLEWYAQSDYLDLFEAMEHDFNRVNVQTFEFCGYVKGIFNKKTYFQSNMDLLNPTITQELFPVDRPVRTKAHDNAPAKFEQGSRVTNSRVSGSCRIYGTVTNSILGRDVIVQHGAVVNDSIIMQSCVIEQGARVEHAIVDRNITVPASTELRGTPDAILIKEKGN